jgi:metacaspase-1
VTNSGYPQGHALIVAVADYRHINPLPDVVLNDARDFKVILSSRQHCGYEPSNITLLLNGAATRAAVLAELIQLGARVAPEDTACIYFSGHGALTGGPDAEESSLLTVDCRITDLAGTSISAAEFSDALHRIKARRLIVFLDACHAAGAGSLKSGAAADGPRLGFSEKTLSRLAEGTGRALMASSRSSETSLIVGGARNSAFTAALLEGLGGAADRHAEGVIKVFDLFDYVAGRVPKMTADAQHPIFKASHLEQNFPIALSRGGLKGFPPIPVGVTLGGDALQVLGTLLPTLYPAGPTDQEIWERAGGDVSRLRLHGSGRGTWFAALKTLELGGGGDRISVDTLIEVALADYPNHPDLANLRLR